MRCSLMLRRLLVILLAVAAGSESAGAAQSPAPFEEVYITNVRANPARCNLGRARRMTFATLVRDYRALSGRCVAVRGTWWRFALYLQSADARASEAPEPPDLSQRRIGLYGPREIMDLSDARARLEVTAVGIVGDCEHWTKIGATIMGYCHALNAGPYIALAEIILSREGNGSGHTIASPHRLAGVPAAWESGH